MKSRNHLHMMYKPIFELNGQIIDTAYYETSNSRLRIGDYVELYINPNNIREFRYKGDRNHKGLIIDLLACCIFPIVAIIMVLIFTNK